MLLNYGPGKAGCATWGPPSRLWASLSPPRREDGPGSDRGAGDSYPGSLHVRSAPAAPRPGRPAPPGGRLPRPPPAGPRCYTDGGPPSSLPAPKFLGPRPALGEIPGLRQPDPGPLTADAARRGGSPFLWGPKSPALLPAVRNQRRRPGFQQVGERKALPGIGVHVRRPARGGFRALGQLLSPPPANWGPAGPVLGEQSSAPGRRRRRGWARGPGRCRDGEGEGAGSRARPGRPRA